MRLLTKPLSNAAFLLSAMVPAMAGAMPPPAPFDLQIYDRTEGRLLPTYQFQGRTYVIGKPGNEYSLSLRNQGGERVMAVGSVDGVNIVTGETAAALQSGYVLSPGQSADINGWRKSLSNTAAFYFTDISDSYAARTGRPNDVGVIGVAVFRERRALPPIRPYAPYRPWNEQGSASPYDSGAARGKIDAANEAASPAPSRADAINDRSASAAQPAPPPASASGASNAPSEYAPRRAEKSLGTGHGRIEDSQTRYTDFQRASSAPEQVITIYYNTYDNLLAMGVPVWRDDNRYSWRKPSPRAFPRDPTMGFVPDPR